MVLPPAKASTIIRGLSTEGACRDNWGKRGFGKLQRLPCLFFGIEGTFASDPSPFEVEPRRKGDSFYPLSRSSPEPLKGFVSIRGPGFEVLGSLSADRCDTPVARAPSVD